MAANSEGQIAAIAATVGVLLAKGADFFLSRRKSDTDHEDTLIKVLMEESKQLRLELKTERDECQKRLDSHQEIIDKLRDELGELKGKVAILERQKE